MNPIPMYIWKERSSYVYMGVTSFDLTSKSRFLHTVWLLISFKKKKTIEKKQRITLDVRHCFMSHLSFFWLFGIYSTLSTLDWNAPTQRNHVLFEFSCVQDIFREPYSNSCNPQRWHRPSIQPFRMHQCPQMPAQSQNTDSKSLRVISHSVIILFRNIMGFEKKFGLTSEKKEKKNIHGVAEILLYVSLALIL